MIAPSDLTSLRSLICVVLALAVGCGRAPGMSQNASSTHDGARLASPTQHVYDPSADAHADLDKAIREASDDGKRILLVFGANWCPECLILDRHLHEAPVSAIVATNFHLVDVDIGRGDEVLDGSPAKNRDLAERFRIPLNLGVPAVAVLEDNGTLLYAQRDGGWTPIGGPSAESVQRFLIEWTRKNPR